MNLAFTGFDGIIAVFFLLSTAQGFARGLTGSALNFLQFFIALYIAIQYRVDALHVLPTPWQQQLRQLSPQWPVAEIIMAAVLFIAICCMISWLARGLVLFLQSIGLHWLDKVLGAGLGMVRMLVLLFLFLIVLSIGRWRSLPAWQDSLALSVSEGMLYRLGYAHNIKFDLFRIRHEEKGLFHEE